MTELEIKRVREIRKESTEYIIIPECLADYGMVESIDEDCDEYVTIRWTRDAVRKLFNEGYLRLKDRPKYKKSRRDFTNETLTVVADEDGSSFEITLYGTGKGIYATSTTYCNPSDVEDTYGNRWGDEIDWEFVY